MAPKEAYTSGRMMALAEKSLQSYLSGNAVDGLINVMCEYIGAPLEDGSYDKDARLHKKATAAFRWTGQIDGIPRTSIIEIRCDNAVSRGITFPPFWKFTAQACRLQAIAHESAISFAQDTKLSNATCKILGMAKSCLIPDESDVHTPGVIVTLNAHDTGVEYLLCARIHGDEWLCSKGYFVDDSLYKGDPFNAESLVIKNIQRDLWLGPDGKRKRIRSHLHRGQLRQLATQSMGDWNLLAAVAQWRAEELRAIREERPMNYEIAASCFECDPFEWVIDHKKQCTQCKVAVQWTWEVGGNIRRSLQTNHIHSILNRNYIASPKANQEDEELLRKLEAVAQMETDIGKAPCQYLGLKLGPGKYEANPVKWPSEQTRKTNRRVYFQWQHVTCNGSPHAVSIQIYNLVHHHRRIPQHPLRHTAPSGLKFSCEFMEAVADNMYDGVKFKGIAYESEKPSLLHRVPSNGLDIQDTPVYWTLPDGQCVCWSVRTLSQARQDQLYPGDEEEAYKRVAAEMGYDVLGTAVEEDLEPFINSPGTLRERLWDNISWERPADETCSCWFIANAGELDKDAPVRLIARNLACLRLELCETRCATSVKLRQTWERRIEENDLAVEALRNNIDLWRHVGGPRPETLLHPSEGDLMASRLAVQRLRCMMVVHGEKASDGMDVFADEICKAVSKLKVVSWDAIHRERFFLTPKGLYDELVRNAQMHLTRRDDEAARRRTRLAAVDDDRTDNLPATASDPPSQGDFAALPRIRPKDKYGLDLDEFKSISQRKPHNFQRAVQLASEVHIDEMRMLLDMHYDEVHLERWQANHKDKKAPERKSEYKVFRSVVQGRLGRLNERISLPASVKNVLRRPEDEADWGKLEALRQIICLELEGCVHVTFESREELDDLIAALAAEKPTKYLDELGMDCSKARAGWRLLIDADAASSANTKKTIIDAVHALPNETVTLQFLTRPRETELAPPMDETAKALFIVTSTLEDLASDRHLSQQELLDNMLLVLFDALFLNQCIKWTGQRVANFQSTECMELARWFLRGHQCCSKALFDGICAQCGALLHGPSNQNTALSNKCTGPPINRDGNEIQNLDGTVKTDAQPPFLLRWSPARFAREAPAIFVHDPDTNRLSLRDNVNEPWLRKTHSRNDDRRTWLYCLDCKNRFFGEGRAREHITFRDKASQAFMKPVKRRGGKPTASATATAATEADETFESEPEEEPSDEEVILDPIDVLDLPEEEPRQRPTQEEYEARWREKKNWHARRVPDEFSRHNLVPLPVEALWQDCPYVPFDDLKSVASQSQLSVCRPYCAFEPANCDDGVPRYAHVTGDVNYRRRAMLQLAGTMGFILNKSTGKAMGLTPHETDCVHECLTWGRVLGNNKILAFFGTVYESFHGACGKLMEKFKSVIPEGCLRARIRATNRECREPIEGELGETLGEEAIGMVVVDSAGHPMKYDALNVFSDAVATQRARLEIDVPGPGGRGWRRTESQIDTQEDLNDAWRKELSDGARHLQEETWVPANDPHYDARVFPSVHPYGTGSLLAEAGSGGTQRFSRNRLMLIESWFRRSAMWGFWSLNRLIQTELFFKNKKRQEAGRRGASAPNDPDPVVRLFGTAQPSDIPESTEWWKRQQRDLFAITDDAELGLMSAMVTVTMNDSCPEMLAAIRRGPMAQPTNDEMIEYLLQRKRRDQERPAFENHSLEHVIAFQRRVQSLKDNFMRRGSRTPLGIIKDWWDSSSTSMIYVTRVL